MDKNIWHNISELKNISKNISGSGYTFNYAKKHNLYELGLHFTYIPIKSVWTPEPIEISKNEEGEIFYRCIDAKRDIYTYLPEAEFDTRLGKFISCNKGEFGGYLTTPKDTIQGNFINVFDFRNKTYAIDSLSHLACAHSKVYEFSDDFSWKEVCFLSGYIFKAIYFGDTSAFLLFSGFNGEFQSKEKSYMFEISDNGFSLKAEFDSFYNYVNNMIIHNDKMILGMDKIVCIVNIETKEESYLTPIDIKAEKNIYYVKRIRRLLRC